MKGFVFKGSKQKVTKSCPSMFKQRKIMVVFSYTLMMVLKQFISIHKIVLWSRILTVLVKWFLYGQHVCFWRLRNTWTPGKDCMMRSPQHIFDGEPENYLGIIIIYTPFNVIVFSRGQKFAFFCSFQHIRGY